MYEWDNNKLDSLIISYNYDEIKNLSYSDKLYVLKYVNVGTWNLGGWSIQDKELLYQINIYINRSFKEKLSWANSHIYKDNLRKTTDILCKLTLEDIRKVNMFSYITIDNLNDLPKNKKDILIDQLRYLYKNNYIAFLNNFIHTYNGETSVADCKNSYNCDQFKRYNFGYIIKHINFVRSICPECEYNEDFVKTINSTLYCYFIVQNLSYYDTKWNLTDDDKRFYSRVFTSKIKLRDAYNVVVLYQWLNNALTSEEEKELLRKFTFKQNEDNYGNNGLINLLDRVPLTETNKTIIANLKFEFALK